MSHRLGLETGLEIRRAPGLEPTRGESEASLVPGGIARSADFSETLDRAERGAARQARRGGRARGGCSGRARPDGRSGRDWLPDMDLNHDKQIQSLLCYRYTIGQSVWRQPLGIRG